MISRERTTENSRKVLYSDILLYMSPWKPSDRMISGVLENIVFWN